MTTLNIVPHLTTALSGPLQALEEHILNKQSETEIWFREQWHLYTPPLNCSVDLRNAGFKLAPVDTNLFPAGFNNLDPSLLPISIQAAQNTIEQQFPGIKKIAIIAESHTRNMLYFNSIYFLQDILTKAGYEVRITSLREDLLDTLSINLDDNKTLTIEPLTRVDNHLKISDFQAELIWLNNDLSEGIPSILQDIEQPIHPPTKLSWASRLKSIHFSHYDKITNEFAQLIGIDPWLISPYFRNCGEVDFSEGEGLDCLVRQTEEILQAIHEKYDHYKIDQKPFVFIKADAGSYGLAVIPIKDAEKIKNLNRKQRSKMLTTKGKKPVSKVIIQEGVYSFETLGEDNAVAEPVVYLIGNHVVGGFYRVHKNRGPDENLNSPGMHFEPLAFAQPCNTPTHLESPDESVNRFYTYGVIARLALLAAAKELQE